MNRPNSASPSKKWLMNNHGSIRWRFIGPNLQNPFDSNSSNEKLEDYIRDKTSLMELCTAQGFMDDTVILKVTNLTMLEFETCHPNLMDIQHEDLKGYFEATGVWKELLEEFKKFQQTCRDELARRQADC